VTAILQAIGGTVGERGPWWIWFFVYSCFGWTATALAVFKTAEICPRPSIGSYMFLGLFLVTETIAFLNGFSVRSALENIIRGGIDIAIIAGLIASANTTPRNEERRI
jgi:hypothetical protein